MKFSTILTAALLGLSGPLVLAQNVLAQNTGGVTPNTSATGSNATGVTTTNPSSRTSINNNTNTGTTTGQATPPNTTTGGLPSATDNNLQPIPRPGTGK